MNTLSVPQKAQADDLARRIEAKLTANPELRATTAVSALGTYLQECETKLVQLMNGEQPSDNEPGSIEFGLVLYWIDTEYPTLAKVLGLPPTAITSSMLSQWNTTLEGAGVVYADGTLVAYSKYAQLDAGWLLASLRYIGLETGVIHKAPFGTNPATVTVPKGSTVTVALVGDWGTGSWSDGDLTCPALQVMQQIQSLQPDFTIHLGDVYYSGTSDEETSNLLQSWYAGPQGTFTLNSNHEMYDGANGLFGTALTASAFQGQQGTTYFAITSGDWILIGLDSAYDSPSLFYMAGAVTDTDQVSFLQGLDTQDKTIIVLTHHNPLSSDGTMFVDHYGNLIAQPSDTCLWNDITSALGRAPDYWYWGHVHNGIVYSDQCAAGTSTQVRCIGHGGIPFGSAYELQSNGSDIPSVTYFADTLLSSKFQNTTTQQQNRVLNGFAVLTLSSEGVQETLYDQTGDSVWSSGGAGSAADGDGLP